MPGAGDPRPRAGLGGRFVERRGDRPAEHPAGQPAGDAAGDRALDPAAEIALIDGNQLPRLRIEARAVIGGDATEPVISAASILAKDHRDRLMAELDIVFPGYGFAEHAGYPTPRHLERLRRFGPCAAHRRSFAPVRVLLPEGDGR
jgi:ribonuclease HII